MCSADRLLPAQQDPIDQLRDQGVLVDRIRLDRTAYGRAFPRACLLAALLRSVARPSLLPVLHAGRVERPADDRVPDTTEVLRTAAVHQHDRVLLQVVPFPGDVTGDLDARGEPDARDLPQGGVGLTGRDGPDTSADATPLRVRPSARGLLFFFFGVSRPFRTSCWIVGMVSRLHSVVVKHRSWVGTAAREPLRLRTRHGGSDRIPVVRSTLDRLAKPRRNHVRLSTYSPTRQPRAEVGGRSACRPGEVLGKCSGAAVMPPRLVACPSCRWTSSGCASPPGEPRSWAATRSAPGDGPSEGEAKGPSGRLGDRRSTSRARPPSGRSSTRKHRTSRCSARSRAA